MRDEIGTTVSIVSRNPKGTAGNLPSDSEVALSIGLYSLFILTLVILIFGAKPVYVSASFLATGAFFWWCRDVLRWQVIAAFQIFVGVGAGTVSVLVATPQAPGDWLALFASGVAIADGFEKLFRPKRTDDEGFE